VDALRAVGATVTITSNVGGGYPDLSVGFRGKTYLIEVKMPKGKLTPDQEIWHSEWQGHAAIVESVEDALVAIDALWTGYDEMARN